MRTALIDIDSRTWIGPEDTSWRNILPAFAHCYDFVIGLCHFEQRGLRQARAHLDTTFGADYFLHSVVEPATSCDAVIVTSAGLIETDTGLCPSASIEDIVGELVRRLSYALMEPKILERIIGPSSTNPRFFALSSATVNAPAPLSRLQSILYRQSVFLSGSFAPLAVDEPPLFIATSKDDDIEPSRWLIDVFAPTAPSSGKAFLTKRADIFAIIQTPCYQPDTRYSPGLLDMIALWPFKIET